MLAPTKVIAGLGAAVGLSQLPCPGGTGDYRTNLASKARTMADAVTTAGADFGFLHIKARCCLQRKRCIIQLTLIGLLPRCPLLATQRTS